MATKNTGRVLDTDPVAARPAAGATAGRASARARLLAAANELFYDEGVHTVGIDRVIERAGVAKASLYSTFGSKDELIRAYLTERHEARQARIRRKLAACDGPRDRLLGIFDALADAAAETGFRGCPFANASAEAPMGSAARQVTDIARAWLLSLFTDLAAEAGAADPAGLGRQLMLLHDGASTSAKLDRDPTAALAARAAAAALLDALVPPDRTRRRGRRPAAT